MREVPRRGGGRDMKQYRKSNIPLARELRRNMTPWERKLWYEYLRYYPARFQRQKAIGNYIVDFYCAKAQLVIELDGSGHYESEQIETDKLRTQQLENMNLRVLRICNLDVDKNFSGVCEYIDMMVKETLPQSASLTAPSTEGAATEGKTIYALGFFDGVHSGHQALLCACLKLAKENNCAAGVLTFASHPDGLVSGKTPPLINTVAEREMLLRRFGMETVVALPFDKTLMTTHWSAFLQSLVARGAVGFVCGSDFRFGAGGVGTAEKLQTFCESKDMPCTIVPQQELDGVRVSSTYIRGLLEDGDVERSNRFLGHPHILRGKVEKGKQLGRTIGVPTANLAVPEGIVQLRFGVYACYLYTEGKQYKAVTNVGMRPTVEGDHVTVEPWILDFEGDLYGKTVDLEFCKFLRPEEKFPSLDALKTQIEKDAAQTRELL